MTREEHLRQAALWEKEAARLSRKNAPFLKGAIRRAESRVAYHRRRADLKATKEETA